MRQRHAVTTQGAQRAAVGVEEQHLFAAGESQHLAIGAPRQSRGPARRSMQYTRAIRRCGRLPELHAAILSGAGERVAVGLPGQVEHARRVLAQGLRVTGDGIEHEDAPFTATDGQRPGIG